MIKNSLTKEFVWAFKELSMKDICPQCEQDYVNDMYIEELDITVWICEECDGLWLDKQIYGTTPLDYQTFLREKGIHPEQKNSTRSIRQLPD